METIFLGIVGFLMALAIFDLSVGASNDAVNFINSAVGSRAARFKVILGIAAVGITQQRYDGYSAAWNLLPYILQFL